MAVQISLIGYTSGATDVYAYYVGRSLASYVADKVLFVEGTAPDTGIYFATVDESKGTSIVAFVGATQPSAWTDALPGIAWDLSGSTVADMIAGFKADAVFGTAPGGLVDNASTAAKSYTAGEGGRFVTFSVDDGTSAVRGARVIAFSGSLIVASGITDASGQVILMLDDGSYSVRVATGPQHEVFPSQSLVVSGDTSVGYSLTVVSMPAPAGPGLCTVRFIVSDGVTPLHGAKASATLVSELNQTIDTTLIANSKLNGTTDSGGIVDLTLIQFESFTRGGDYRIKVEYRGRTIHDRVVRIPTASAVLAEDLN